MKTLRLAAAVAAILVLVGAPQPRMVVAQNSDSFSLTIRVFLDVIGSGGYPCPGCNGTFESGDGRTPLPPMVIVVRDAGSGEELTRQTTRQVPAGTGQAYASAQFGFEALPTEGITVELEEAPDEFPLCPNSERVRALTEEDFAGGSAFESYSVWHGCPLLGTPTPTATVPPTPTGTATTSATRTPSPIPTPTVTSTPSVTIVPSATPPAQTSWEVFLPLIRREYVPPPPTPTPTPPASATPTPSRTPRATDTPRPTNTPRPTDTPPPPPPTATATPTPQPVPCGIRGRVFEVDEHDNPVGGVPGIRVDLYGPEDRSATTSGDGSYSFPDLEQGVYEMHFRLPSGWTVVDGKLLWVIDFAAGCREVVKNLVVRRGS